MDSPLQGKCTQLVAGQEWPEPLEFSKQAEDVLKDRYTYNGETIEEAFWRACSAYSDDVEHALRLYSYIKRKWFMFATPILCNGGTVPRRGLPISCFLNHVPDSREGLATHFTENIWLSSMGGGIAGDWSQVRSKDTKTSTGNVTSGALAWMNIVDAETVSCSQGSTRRGSYAAYMDISHPEIVDFIQMRKPHGGDVTKKNLNLHHGVNVPDAFMIAAERDEEWPLVDPHTKQVVSHIRARDLWYMILTCRVETGEPYIHWIDESNRQMPNHLKDAGMTIRQSNLCTEIILPTDEHRTAVCCLSSVNLETFDEWENDELFIEDLARMLDNVLTDFIDNAPEELKYAVNSAQDERSIGIGAMGFHSYLQSKGLPFGSAMAKVWNTRMFKHIREKCNEANRLLGDEKGACQAAEGVTLVPIRFSHVMAIAPNASSSVMLGCSPSIEPWAANAFNHKTLSGTHVTKNKYLESLLESCYDKNNEDVWASIVANGGSVQHLEFMSDDHKEVFLTAMELDQDWIIEHAGDRQKFIDQAQSVNVFFKPNASKSYLHRVHWNGWKKGLKTLYYCRSEQLSKGSDISGKRISNRTDRMENGSDGCLGCEG